MGASEAGAGAAGVRAVRYGYLLVMRVHGPLHLRTAARMRAAMRASAIGLPSRLLIDLRSAYALMPPEALLRASLARPLPSSMVAGILFGPHMAVQGYWYCRELAARGHSRVFFSCLSDALDWAPEAADFLARASSPRRRATARPALES